jgi:hypothetical protein
VLGYTRITPIKRLREQIVAMPVYIRDHEEVSGTERCMPLAQLEGKLYSDYPNDWLRAVVRFLIKQNFVTGNKTRMGGGLLFFKDLKVTNKGLHYINGRWCIEWVWDQVKDIIARIVVKSSR